MAVNIHRTQGLVFLPGILSSFATASEIRMLSIGEQHATSTRLRLQQAKTPLQRATTQLMMIEVWKEIHVAGNMLTHVQHPNDATYQYRRKQVIRDLLKMKKADVGDLLMYMADPQNAIKDESNMSQKIMGEIYGLPDLPLKIKGILDSTSGTTGNVLIRQDLEPLIYR